MNTTLSTTHNYHSLKLIIFRNKILFQNVPMTFLETEVLIFLKDSYGKEYNKQIDLLTQKEEVKCSTRTLKK